MCAAGGYPARASRQDRGWRALLLGQGTYFLVTGLWPLMWMDGFLAVTGPKEELWLVRTVGLLAAAIGLVLVVAGWRRTYVPEVALLGAAGALAFLLVDLVGWAAGVLRWTYLADAVVEGLILLAWALLTARALARRGEL